MALVNLNLSYDELKLQSASFPAKEFEEYNHYGFLCILNFIIALQPTGHSKEGTIIIN